VRIRFREGVGKIIHLHRQLFLQQHFGVSNLLEGRGIVQPVEEAVMSVWNEMLAAGKLVMPVADETKRCA
jgi:hypothetical protein